MKCLQIQLYSSVPAAYQDYDPAAPIIAKSLAESIAGGDPCLRVEHIGSSSVPGCGGKGYIDLAVIYPDGKLDVAKRVLADLGFQPQQGREPFPEERPMRVGCVDYNGREYRLHAHVLAGGSSEVGELLWFRDRLREDPALRAQYEAEKEQLINSGVTDGFDYATAKGAFVERVLSARRMRH